MKVLTIDVDWLLPGSRYHLKELNNLFFAKCETAKEIAFGRYHHQILQAPQILQSNNIILHNIDHHHDLVYEDWQEQGIKEGVATHGAWIGNLIFDNKIAEYWWYKNSDSDVIRPESFLAASMLSRNPPVSFMIEETLEAAWRLDYDLIFVSLSQETLDKKLYCVYDTYIDYCKYKYEQKTVVARINPDLPNTPIRVRN
tara:strand:+ start:43 stop:639 length:597 start_codon:yes stop_codon:yes gene_type:complete